GHGAKRAPVPHNGLVGSYLTRPYKVTINFILTVKSVIKFHLFTKSGVTLICFNIAYSQVGKVNPVVIGHVSTLVRLSERRFLFE
uniref:hypothetical protein n=1 Tax=Streptomyces turgidiscabies TaxID=85558 RepID=UPI0038F73A32